VNLDEINALAAELDNFLDAVRKTRETGIVAETKVSGEAGLRALKLAVAIEEEARRYNKHYGFNFAPPIDDKMD
jgi:predicted dehydrogenase